ncbi:MAG: bifunctional alpha,alpha-trehalose-phosphate synthase (UDP-forming)/trehalose-phosphatase [Chlorobi bacterium]|nr:bifunctional alpha,alpha-trehalose-phosphate synthase (UDP-forming)/trehalose-phosphatase [Chlorobiota bacterium]
MKRLIIASNELPVNIIKEDGNIRIIPADELKYSGLTQYYEHFDTCWVGHANEKVVLTKSDKKDLSVKLNAYHCSLVSADSGISDLAVHGFAGNTLWPLFHYFTSNTQYEDEMWEAYVKFNRLYADQIGSMISSDDILWIHDYHLLLLPQMIREQNPEVSVGLFIHIPFPSFEIFRLLPWRNEILAGMLGADLIGFQVFDYVRHMLSCVRRLMGVDTIFNRVMVGARTMKVDVFPKGIDYARFTEEIMQFRQDGNNGKSNLVREMEKRFPKKGENKYILSIDPLDYTKGIPQRLKAFELFLSTWPEYQGRVTLLLITLPFERLEERNETIIYEVNELVGRINGRHGTLSWVPVVFISHPYTPEELVALYAYADIALIVPFRDGMNMTAKEFVAAHRDLNGVLILSELAGASKELHEALIVNPNNLHEVSSSIKEALDMDDREQRRRMVVMNTRLKKYPVTRWAKEFISSLEGVKELQQTHLTKRITPEKTGQIHNAYEKAARRILFLDYDGTLSAFKKNPEDARPDKELYNILKKLTSDPKNRIVIISGRDKETLSRWFSVEWPIHFVAEHGVWLKEPGGEWYMMEPMDREWKNEVLPLLDYYIDQTPKAFIEEKNFSLVWHYRKSDPDLGIQRAWELKEQLRNLTANLNLEILDGDKVLEIKYSGINKGKAALQKLSQDDYDFILAIGDDWTDEYTFDAMPPESYTIKVGTKTTKATLFVEGVEDVRKLLSVLSG